MNVTRFRSFRVGARSIECFSFLSSRQKMLFLYPRYGKRIIFRAMQAMQFIRVSGHTVKNFIYPQCVVQFYAHKKTATAAGRLRFFLFFY